MNLSAMISFVRAQADADEEDAPQSTMTVYARAAYNDIKRRIYPWPRNFVAQNFTTTADQEAYEWSEIGTGVLEYVRALRGPTEKQIYIDFQTYLELLEGNDISHRTNEADYFTTDGNKIYLYPTPSNTGVVYTIYGYRRFADWPAGDAEPDLPREFDETICWYMLARYYMAQEDLELAQIYMADYEQSVNNHIAGAIRTSSTVAGPRVFGGDHRVPMGYDDWVRRNTEG